MVFFFAGKRACACCVEEFFLSIFSWWLGSPVVCIVLMAQARYFIFYES